MSLKTRPTTTPPTPEQREMARQAREAVAQGKSLKPVAFRALQSKAEKAAYLQAHL